MKVGIIAPIKLLEEYCITDIQYVLPKLLENKEYRDFYLKRKSRGDTIILDCKKPGWKREPEDAGVVKEAIHLLQPSLIILPSYMYNCKATIKVSSQYKKLFRNMSEKFVGCLEGTNFRELIECRGKMKTPIYASSSHIYNNLLPNRKIIWTHPLIYIENHLNLEELDGLEGTLVTSLPVRLGLEGRLLSDYSPSPPSLTFYEEEDRYPMITKKNVEEAIEYYEI